MWNPSWKWIAVGALALVGAQAAMALDAGGNGLGWRKLQGRMSLGTASTSPGLRSETPGFDATSLKLSSLSLMADYYLMPAFSQGAPAGGLRATSGVLFGPRSSPWSGPGSGAQFSIDRRAIPTTPDGSTDSATSPYVGIGYTGLSLKGGWGFSADVGVLAGRFGRSLGQSLDDQVRELRLQPVLQLGVSYSF